MALVVNLRGPSGANGVVNLFVATLSGKAWSLAKSSTSVSYVSGNTYVAALIAGWYSVNWGQPVQYAVGAHISLSSQGGECCVAGPLT